MLLFFSSVRHSASQMGRDGTKVDYRFRKARPSFIHDEYAQLSIQTGSNIKQNMQKPYGVDDKTWRDFKNDFVCGLFMVNIFNDMVYNLLLRIYAVPNAADYLLFYCCFNFRLAVFF